MKSIVSRHITECFNTLTAKDERRKLLDAIFLLLFFYMILWETGIKNKNVKKCKKE